MRTESCERPESDRRQEEKCVGDPGLATNTREPPDWRDRGEINQILGRAEYWLASQYQWWLVMMLSSELSPGVFHYLCDLTIIPGPGLVSRLAIVIVCHPVNPHHRQIGRARYRPRHHSGQTPLETQIHDGRSVSLKFDCLADVCKLNWQMPWFKL